MKIISKRRAMTIYRRHPQSRLFRFCTGKYPWSGSVLVRPGRAGYSWRTGGVRGTSPGPSRPVHPPDVRHPELIH